MKKLFFLSFYLVFLNSGFTQKQNLTKIKSDPIDIINKIIDYGMDNKNTFNGLCKVGYVEGESYFNFLHFSKKFPNIIVNYNVLGKEVREGGILKNIRFINSGIYNTKIIIADWVNFSKNNAGSGKFELSVLDENHPGEFYIGIKGYNWSYFINVKLKSENFQELINLLTYKGDAYNFIEKQNLDNYITEQKPEYLKGDSDAWVRYLNRNLNKHVAAENNAPTGKYLVTVQFRINRNGEITDVIPIENPGYGTFEELKRVIMKSSKWNPGIKNNRVENFYWKQSVVFEVF